MPPPASSHTRAQAPTPGRGSPARRVLQNAASPRGRSGPRQARGAAGTWPARLRAAALSSLPSQAQPSRRPLACLTQVGRQPLTKPVTIGSVLRIRGPEPQELTHPARSGPSPCYPPVSRRSQPRQQAAANTPSLFRACRLQRLPGQPRGTSSAVGVRAASVGGSGRLAASPKCAFLRRGALRQTLRQSPGPSQPISSHQQPSALHQRPSAIAPARTRRHRQPSRPPPAPRQPHTIAQAAHEPPRFALRRRTAKGAALAAGSAEARPAQARASAGKHRRLRRAGCGRVRMGPERGTALP